jgi:hypothetical protein
MSTIKSEDFFALQTKARDKNVKRVVTVNIAVNKIFKIADISSIVLHYAHDVKE